VVVSAHELAARMVAQFSAPRERERQGEVAATGGVVALLRDAVA
jgi:hypothetical protein